MAIVKFDTARMAVINAKIESLKDNLRRELNDSSEILDRVNTLMGADDSYNYTYIFSRDFGRFCDIIVKNLNNIQEYLQNKIDNSNALEKTTAEELIAVSRELRNYMSENNIKITDGSKN